MKCTEEIRRKMRLVMRIKWVEGDGEGNDEFDMEKKLWRSKNYAKQKTEEEIKTQTEIEFNMVDN
jgi:hypothetical protein